MAGEILSDNRRGLLMGYNDGWRKWRKALHSLLNSNATNVYKPIQDMESKQFMHELLVDPVNYRTHSERYATSVVVSITYGRRVTDIHNDAVVNFNRESMHYLTSVK